MSDVVQFFEMEMSTYTGMNYEMGVTILRETVKPGSWNDSEKFNIIK